MLDHGILEATIKTVGTLGQRYVPVTWQLITFHLHTETWLKSPYVYLHNTYNEINSMLSAYWFYMCVYIHSPGQCRR